MKERRWKREERRKQKEGWENNVRGKKKKWSVRWLPLHFKTHRSEARNRRVIHVIHFLPYFTWSTTTAQKITFAYHSIHSKAHLRTMEDNFDPSSRRSRRNSMLRLSRLQGEMTFSLLTCKDFLLLLSHFIVLISWVRNFLSLCRVNQQPRLEEKFNIHFFLCPSPLLQYHRDRPQRK